MRYRTIAALSLAGLLAGGFTLRAADDGGYSMKVVVGGQARPEYARRGTVYVEALRDQEYSIRLTNPLSCRVAVALSVDGLNSIDAKRSSASKASKWVLGPYESLVIPGWQVNGREARRFYFTGERDSYGAWLGQTSNLGVIEAVFFREKPRPRPVVRRSQPWDFDRKDAGSEAPAEKNYSEQPESRPTAPPASGAPAPSAQSDSIRGESAQKKSAGALSDDYAATGIGERTDQPVEWVNLNLEPDPAAVVRIRYEFRPELVKLGIFPDPYAVEAPLARREAARGFSGSYCPDP